MEVLPLLEPNLLQRLSGRVPRENAFREVHNLLAQAADPFSLESRDVDVIVGKTGVDVRRHFRARLMETFKAALLRAAETRRGDEEIPLSDVVSLARTLGLSDEQGEHALRDAGRHTYREIVQERIDSPSFRLGDEVPDLPRAANLSLTVEDATRVYAELAQARLTRLAEAAVADERYSPDEERVLAEEADRLGVELSFNAGTSRALERMRLFWQIEEGDPPTVDPGVHLQKKEVCYAVRDVVWYEHRKVTTRIQYGGPTARIRIAKGLYFRAGDVAVRRVSEDVHKEIDRGRLLLTNKRLLFIGAKKNSNVRLNKILDFTPFSNGIDVQKDAGKSPFLEFSDDVDVFALYLSRALVDDRA